MKNNSHTLTKGSVGKGILLFALPLLGSSLIQQLYSTVDLIFVGQLLGTKASAAIGASGLIVTCMIGFFNGMAVGTNVFAARHYGARRFEQLKKLIQTIFWTGIIGGFFLTVIGLVLSPVFLTWMGTPESIFPLAVRYLRIYMASMISVVSYNLLSGVLRALGDSRTPMLYQFFGGIINVFADFIFLYVFHMGVEGTAFATLFSQTFAAIGVMIHLYRLRKPYALRIRFSDCSLKEFTDILKVGVPAGVQSIIITLSNIIIQSQINTLGVTSVASFTVYFRVELIIYLPIVALGQAVVSFIGQNYGAGNWERIKKGNRLCIFGGSLITFAACILLIIAMPVILNVFTKDAAVAAQTLEIVKVTFPFYFFYTVLECFSSNLRGFGKAFLPMIVTVISFCGFRIVALFALMAKNPSPDKVALSYPISWGIAAAAMAILYVRNNRNRSRKI
ncbi:Multi antimicrobial extrusion protein [Anaerobutyricum hallii]|uniref:Multi antimicrobial extrusion protein n=1 Tax=Anaerobutyricum hallii TaxID=39488 RepID=A0A285PNZ1_9FIRM|nr:MATE family efflux transporter [Anaerobutyricum hallii]SOB71319.1 Multi antimicrobial extrusion protein [Anaerobutyricum hallii]